MKIIAICYFFISSMAFANSKSDKDLWKEGCIQMYVDHNRKYPALEFDLATSTRVGEKHCKQMASEYDKNKSWKLSKHPRLDGCSDEVKYLLDSAGVTDRQRRKNMLIEFCF